MVSPQKEWKTTADIVLAYDDNERISLVIVP